MKVYKKLDDLFLSLYSGTAVAFPTKHVIHLPETFFFILMTSCRTERETVSRMEQDGHSIVVAAIISGVAVSLRAHGRHGRHFEHILWCFRGSVC